MNFRKIFAAVMAAVLLGTCCQGNVWAETAYEDYTAGEMPANMIEGSSPAETYANNLVRNSTSVQQEKTTAAQIMRADGDIVDNPNSGYIGFVFKKLQFEKDKSYVFTLKLKSGTDEKVRAGIAMTNEKANTTSYPLECGAEGIELDGEYKTVAVTIKPADGFQSDAQTHGLVLGFLKGTAAGSRMHLKRDEPDSVYFAEEAAHDISCTLLSDKETIRQGSSINLKAEVVNQVGNVGTLSQNFDWLVMNEDKTAQMQGFELETGTNGEVVIDIDESVPQGRYAVVAVSRDYDGFIKTAYVDVLKKQINDIDIDVQKPANLILKPDDPGFAEKTVSDAVDIKNGENSLIVTAAKNVDNALMMLDGIKIRTALSKGFASDFHFTPGKSYVISAKVRRAEESREENVRFTASFVQDSEQTFALTKEYGAEGMELTDEWQTFAASVIIPESYDSSNKKRQLCLGMPNGSKEGSAFEIQLSVYIAEEAPMTMECTLDNEAVSMDNSVKATARLLNQLGCEGNLAQKFEWYALDSDRSEKTEELIINAEENNAEVSVQELTEPGDYYIVAETKAGGKTARKCIKLVADKPEVWSCIKDAVNALSVSELSQRIDMYTDRLKISFIPKESRNAQIFSEILKNETPIETENEEEFVQLVKKATVVAVYCENSDNIILYNEDGSFAFSDELDMKDINGVTFNALFENDMTADGRKMVQKALGEKKYGSISEFEKEFALEVILKIMAYPKTEGSGFVEKALTKANTDFVNIKADTYINATDKTAFNKKLARNTYSTAEELERAIVAAKPATQSSSASGSSTGSGKVPSGSVVSAAPVSAANEANSSLFKDVDEKHWAYADIYHLRERGVISGIDENTFDPDGAVTREQFVKMLCEVMDYAPRDKQTSYTDVDENAWYAPYVAAASEKQVIYGTDEQHFGIGMPIKRQDLCVILWRALGEEEIGEDVYFIDSNDISEYAKPAVEYMSAFGIISGYDDLSFRPNDYCTRAQSAKILCKILNMKGLL